MYAAKALAHKNRDVNVHHVMYIIKVGDKFKESLNVLAVDYSVIFVPSSSVHPQLIVSDGCASPSLALLEVSSC